MLTIYGAPHSRTFRVIWLANEIGIPYQHVPVTFSVPNAQCKEPWYIALNPNGLVPSIDDNGFVMWELRRSTSTSPKLTSAHSIHRRRKTGVECFSGRSLSPTR